MDENPVIKKVTNRSESTTANIQTKKHNPIVIVLTLLIIVLVSIVILLIKQNKQLNERYSQSKLVVSEVPTSSIAKETNKKWSTYSNKELGLSFEYPERWVSTSSGSHINVIRTQYNGSLILSENPFIPTPANEYEDCFREVVNNDHFSNNKLIKRVAVKYYGGGPNCGPVTEFPYMVVETATFQLNNKEYYLYYGELPTFWQGHEGLDWMEAGDLITDTFNQILSTLKFIDQ